MNKFFKYIVPALTLLFGVGFSSCVNDLDVTPKDPSLKSLDEITAEQLFTKCYAVIGVAGNGGANGDSDVDGIDGGTSGYVRQMWNANELTTDEAICGWGDDGIPQFDYNTYDESHPMLQGFYYRLYTSVYYCNEYLDRYSENDATMTAEVRFLRALSYYFLMDCWGNVPFITEPKNENPPQASRAEVFNFVETELKEILPDLRVPTALKKGQDGWGRVDQDAANLLLARLYLNAQVYTGTAHWQEAKEYAQKVMEGPHKLNTTEVAAEANGIYYAWTPYQMLFMGDNSTTSAATEAVFPILQDGIRTTSWGTTLFVMASTFDGNMYEYPFDETLTVWTRRKTNGTGQTWGGNRARPQLVRKFFPLDDAPEYSPGYYTAMSAGDDRALFNTGVNFTYQDTTWEDDAKTIIKKIEEKTVDINRGLDCDPVATFAKGYAVAKFNNFKTDLSSGKDATFPDGDFFLMRSAEAYLTFAEAEFRMNGATQAAIDAINALRDRAHASQVNASTLNLNFILDEWSREFYFEGRRRIDLIRFDKFGGNNGYNWQWKGGKFEGKDFPATRNVFAIPENDMTVNRNLVQNPGY